MSKAQRKFDFFITPLKYVLSLCKVTGIRPHKAYALGRTLTSALSVPGASILIWIGSALPSLSSVVFI